MLLFAALLAAVVNPVVFSPFLYPLETWSPAIQGCVYTAIALYGFVGLLTLKAVLTHEPAKPLEWLWAFVFIVLGWLYVVTHFTLQAVAFIKVFIGKEGAWEVTERCARRPPERCGEVPGRGCIGTAGGRFSRSTSGLEAAGLGGATLGRGGSPRDGVAAMEPTCGGGSGGGGGSAAVDAPRLGSGAVRSGSGTAALRVPLLAAEESAAEAGGGPGEV